MKLSVTVLLVCLMLLTGALMFGETLTGTVKNGTTGNVSAGDDVILIKLGQGMEEAGRTKSDAKGKFSFNIEDASGPHLVRVIHQGVTYHAVARPGANVAEPEVFDVSRKLDGINAVADLMYLQTGDGQLGVSRLFAVDNSSKPPRTQMNDQNFEFYLPEDAQIDQSQAQTANGQWVQSAPVPQKEKGRYAFTFPLRPGTTQFQVSYHMPYKGSVKIDPKPLYALEHFVVVLPQTIQFAAVQSGLYTAKQPPEPDAVAQIASSVRPGQQLAFSISGTGMLQSQKSSGESEQGNAAPLGKGRDDRPGGGLGPPIDAPDPLEKYRWPILIGFAVVLFAGAIYIAKRPLGQPSEYTADDVDVTAPAKPAKTAVAGRSGLLLEALKEELFALELDRKQGKLSSEEYDKAKAALDQTLDRALKREGSRSS